MKNNFFFNIKHIFSLILVLFPFGQIISGQTGQARDYVAPEVVITSPKYDSRHNYFPTISGTAVDKPYSDSMVTGVSEVRVAIRADGQVWDGREWINATGGSDDYKFSASLSGQNWGLSYQLPQKLKPSINNPKEKIKTYSIYVMVRDGAGQRSLTSVSFTIEPLSLIVLDANKKFSGMDFSAGKIGGLSKAAFEHLVNLSLPIFNYDGAGEAFRIGAVADGTTKLLVIARGHNPGSVIFKSSPESKHSELCNKTPLLDIDFSSTRMPDALSGNGQENLIKSSIERINSMRGSLLNCTTGTRIEEDNFLFLGEYQKSENDYYWFSLYTVPNFISPEVENSLMGQMISLTATLTPARLGSSMSVEQDPSEIPFYLKRPPILLVHGLNDESKSWNLNNNTVLQDKGFDVRYVDYRETNGESFETNKLVMLGSELYLPQGRGVQVKTGAKTVLNDYRHLKYAISKVDVVGHSMGGNLARIFYQQPEYHSDDNFYEGYIRRLITIGTPHLGSNVANILINDVRNYGSNGCGKLGFWWAGGEKASVDLSIGSSALLKTGQTKIPSHAITSIVESSVLRGDYYWRYLATKDCLLEISLLPFKGMKPLGTILQNRQKDFIDSLCAGKPCDWTVQEDSQKGGLVQEYITPFKENIHHGEEISSIPIRERVRDLLMGNEDNFAPEGFPAVSSLKDKFPPTSLNMFVSNRENMSVNNIKKINTASSKKGTSAVLKSNKTASVFQMNNPSSPDELDYALSNLKKANSSANKPLSPDVLAMLQKLPPAQRTEIVKLFLKIHKNKVSLNREELAKLTGSSIEQSGKTTVTPPPNPAGFNLKSIIYNLPNNWQKIETANSVAVFASDGIIDGRITKGLIYGTLPTNGEPLTIMRVEKEILKMNPNLRSVSNEIEGSLAGNRALAQTYRGFTSLTNLNEEIRVYVINLPNKEHFFVLTIFPEAEAKDLFASFSQILSSFSIK